MLNNIDVSCDYLKKLIKDIVVSKLAFKEGEKVIIRKWDVIAYSKNNLSKVSCSWFTYKSVCLQKSRGWGLNDFNLGYFIIAEKKPLGVGLEWRKFLVGF